MTFFEVETERRQQISRFSVLRVLRRDRHREEIKHEERSKKKTGTDRIISPEDHRLCPKGK